MLKISELKEIFIRNVEYQEKMDEKNQKIIELAKELITSSFGLLTRVESLNQSVSDGLKTFEKLYAMRESIKSFNGEIHKFKVKGGLPEKEFLSFLERLSHILIAVEVSTTKVEILLKGQPMEKLEDFKEKLLFSKNSLNKKLMDLKEFGEKIQDLDGMIVQLLQELFANQKAGTMILKDISLLFSHGHEPSEFSLGLAGSKEIN
jgi:hypothetical protein